MEKETDFVWMTLHTRIPQARRYDESLHASFGHEIRGYLASSCRASIHDLYRVDVCHTGLKAISVLSRLHLFKLPLDSNNQVFHTIH
jgi:hypothetical protein